MTRHVLCCCLALAEPEPPQHEKMAPMMVATPRHAAPRARLKLLSAAAAGINLPAALSPAPSGPCRCVTVTGA